MHVNNFILIIYKTSNQVNIPFYENMRNDFIFSYRRALHVISKKREKRRHAKYFHIKTFLSATTVTVTVVAERKQLIMRFYIRLGIFFPVIPYKL